MKKIRIVLVDDETLLLEQLEYILKKDEKVEIAGMYSDAAEALEGIKVLKPDAVFLDVSMPVLNGFQLAEEIRRAGISPFLVFVTGHREFALKAFDSEAMDYIVKPFEKERVLLSIERMEKRRQALGENIVTLPQSNWFPVEESKSIRLIPLETICFFVAEKKKTKVVSKEGNWLTSMTLGDIEMKYAHMTFFRCHKSYIVNLNFIEKIIPMFHQNYVIRLKGSKEEIPVSRHYAKRMTEVLGM